MPWKLRLLWWKTVAVYRHVRGEQYCRRFHRPMIACSGGYGGRDVFGRRRKEYISSMCPVCGNRWESNRSMLTVIEKWNAATKESA